MTSEVADVAGGRRVDFLDNLRTAIVFLVVLYHAGGVYEATGMWASFWIVDDPSTNTVSGLTGLVLDIFLMPTLFFVSGYFVPASLRNRSRWIFLRTKFRRLMLPWIVAVLVLIPLYKVMFLLSRGLPQQSWTTYFHFSNGFISQSWLWFLPVLFAFNVLYVLGSMVRMRVPNVTLKGAVIGTFVVGFAYSAGMDLLGFRGWTLTPFIDFQHERVLIYLMFFLVGTLCSTQRAFDGRPRGTVLYNIVNSTAWIPITVYIFFLIFPVVFNPGGFVFSRIVDRTIVWFCFHLSLLCLVYGVVQTFWRYLDRPGPIWSELNPSAYHVYIIHVIVLGLIAMLLLNTAMPSVLKHFILAASTYVACNLIVMLSRRVVITRA